MRISDWSSDVCSSDLIPVHVGHAVAPRRRAVTFDHLVEFGNAQLGTVEVHDPRPPAILGHPRHRDIGEIGERIAERRQLPVEHRSEEHTSELQSLMRISYAVFCLKKKTNTQ